MSERQREFDLESFQTEVQRALKDLRRETAIVKAVKVAGIVAAAAALAAIVLGGYLWIIVVILTVAGSGVVLFVGATAEIQSKRRKEKEEKLKSAEKLAKQRDVKKYICPALQSASDDAFEIAKVITPILVPLALAGTISIPLDPVLFAWIALTIARMGIASLCVDYISKASDKR